MFCVYCGEENPSRGKFCRRCGKPLLQLQEQLTNIQAEQNTNRIAEKTLEVPMKMIVEKPLEVSSKVVAEKPSEAAPKVIVKKTSKGASKKKKTKKLHFKFDAGLVLIGVLAIVGLVGFVFFSSYELYGERNSLVFHFSEMYANGNGSLQEFLELSKNTLFVSALALLLTFFLYGVQKYGFSTLCSFINLGVWCVHYWQVYQLWRSEAFYGSSAKIGIRAGGIVCLICAAILFLSVIIICLENKDLAIEEASADEK